MIRDTVTMTREAWNDVSAYIEQLEHRVKELEEELYGTDESE